MLHSLVHVHHTIGIGSEILQYTVFGGRADRCIIVGPPGIAFGIVDSGSIMACRISDATAMKTSSRSLSYQHHWNHRDGWSPRIDDNQHELLDGFLHIRAPKGTKTKELSRSPGSRVIYFFHERNGFHSSSLRFDSIRLRCQTSLALPE